MTVHTPDLRRGPRSTGPVLWSHQVVRVSNTPVRCGWDYLGFRCVTGQRQGVMLLTTGSLFSPITSDYLFLSLPPCDINICSRRTVRP